MRTADSAQARRTGPLLALLAILTVIAIVYFTPLREYIRPAELARRIESVGDYWWAPALLIALYVGFNVLLLPATFLTLAAGAVWGWFRGGLWVLVASSIASAAPYLIARLAASDFVERLIRKRAGVLLDKLRDEGFMTLLLMRLVPLVPYNVLNYAAGLTGIRPRDYFAATFLGTIPGIFIFTYLADAISSGVVTPRDAFLRILLAGVLLAVLAIASRMLSKRLKRRLRI